MATLSRYQRFIKGFFRFEDSDASPDRYIIFRRKIIVLMIVVTLIPLTLMAIINYHQYRNSLKDEIVNPMSALSNKTKLSFELFLEEKLSNVRFIASAYPLKDLSDEKTLSRIFRVLKKEFEGFVDLGLINCDGVQITYAGPYALLGKDYSQQSWFQEVLVRGVYISDVFMGYRKFPHIAIAVTLMEEGCEGWVLRATIGTEKFDNLIASMGLDPESDAFLINDNGMLQTNSKYYGKVLDKFPLLPPMGNFGTYMAEAVDPLGREVFSVYTHFNELNYVLVLVKPRSVILKSWFTLQGEMLLIFSGSVILIFLVVFKLADVLVKNMREADEKRELAYRELEHSQKLSSIGRLAAGVAHEINNPLAIINEKAGLMKDLVEYQGPSSNKDKYLDLTGSILHSVERCKTITHRLLGFARRMEIQFEILNINVVVQETLGFLEQEYLYRNIDIRLQLAQDLPQISSDLGQLQQVFLNILSNAFAAVEDGGQVTVISWDESPERIAVTIEDNGCGMSEETLKHIFEPFFTTKKGYGTGLGLPITYGIVKKMGGDFKVESKVGEGTKFTVFLLKDPKEIGEKQ